MHLRAFLLHSRAGRVLCVAVLAVFLVLCGIHIGSAHHDGDGDSFGLAQQVVLFLAAAVALLLIAHKKVLRAQDASPPLMFWLAEPFRELSPSDLALASPLRC